MKNERDTIKSTLAVHGMTTRDWARAHGFSEALVYRVLASERIPKRGESFLIAMKLGLTGLDLGGAPSVLLDDLKGLGKTPIQK